MITLKNHIPYRFKVNNDQIEIHWLNTGDVTYSAPFFDETISRCLSLNPGMANFKCISSLDNMIEAAEYADAVPVTSFIFHISRCGSTLLSQSLSLSEENIVLSEVPVFDAILRSNLLGLEKKKEVLLALVKLYGQRRNGKQKKLYIKLDSWSVHYWRLFRELWPDVPFLMLYRNPMEVLQSHRKNAGMHAVPGLLEPWLFNLDMESVADLRGDEYLAKVLNYYFSAFIVMKNNDNLCEILSYHQGIEGIVATIGKFTGVAYNDDFMDLVKNRSQYHSKDDGRLFSETMPVNAIPAYMLQAFEKFTALENIRQSSQREC